MADKPLSKPLPADLPENWQYNQVVAPTGAEVGLAEQYGYNYLMAQLNAAHQAINSINEAFSELAAMVNGKIPLTQLPMDSALSDTSGNPVQNKAVSAALAGKVPVTRRVNNKALSADISLNAADVGALASNGKALTAGTADAAVKLQTARSFQVNLGSTAVANFDGSGNANPGIYGILGVGNGGTGANSAAQALANLGGCRIVIGIYAGNGQQRTGSTLDTVTGGQFINLGIEPKFVLVGEMSQQNGYGYLCASVQAISASYIRTFMQANSWKVTAINNRNYGIALDIVGTGFYVGATNANIIHTNVNGLSYAYIAII